MLMRRTNDVQLCRTLAIAAAPAGNIATQH
jgi:hypothetical protein